VYFPRRLGGACNCSHLRFLYHNLVPKELRVNDSQLGRAVGSYIRFGDFEDKYKKKEDLEIGTTEEDMDGNSTTERPLKKIRRQIHLEDHYIGIEGPKLDLGDKLETAEVLMLASVLKRERETLNFDINSFLAMWSKAGTEALVTKKEISYKKPSLNEVIMEVGEDDDLLYLYFLLPGRVTVRVTYEVGANGTNVVVTGERSNREDVKSSSMWVGKFKQSYCLPSTVNLDTKIRPSKGEFWNGYFVLKFLKLKATEEEVESQETE